MTAAAASRTIHVLTALEGEESRLVAAAGTIASLVAHLRPGWRMRLSVLHENEGGDGRAKFTRSFDPAVVDVEWLDPVPTRFDGSGAPPEHKHVSYHRLFATDYLSDADKVIWIDPDVLVRHDVVEMWEAPMPESFYCLAVQDPQAPFFDSTTHPRLAKRNCDVSLNHPVPNCRSFGFQGTEPYFNGGVMVLNLAAWRRDGIADALQKSFLEHWPKMVWCDQFFMNLLFVGRWGKLDSRWNRLLTSLRSPDPSLFLMEGKELDLFLNDLWTVHYGLSTGPWAVGGCVGEAEFFAAVDRTAWAGWRRPAPPFQFGRWIQDRAHSLKRRLKKGIDKLVGRKS